MPEKLNEKKSLDDALLSMRSMRIEPAEDMAVFFNRRAEHYDELHLAGLDEGKKSKDMIAVYLPEYSTHILDLGMWTCLELQAIYLRFPLIKVTGIDISVNMLEQALKKYKDKGIKTLCGDYMFMDIGEQYYDAVVSSMTLHHYNEEKKSLLYLKILNALKPNGVYIECDYMMSDDFAHISNTVQDEPGEIKGGLVHNDRPLPVNVQISLMSGAGFIEVKQVWRNGKLAIITCKKQ